MTKKPRPGRRTNQATTTDASRRSHVTLSALALALALTLAPLRDAGLDDRPLGPR
jgi:hypothetical protein